MEARFTFIDLFSGIGGFHLGLSSLGGKCLMASDINDVACRTYAKNFEILPKGDIRNLKLKDIPIHDVLCAGFPCQTFSNIGPRTGLNDPRGELIFEVFRILKIRQPKAFILENVKGLVSHNAGKTISFIADNLEKLGYNVYHDILEAKDYGLPQIRKRLFIVGIKKKLDTGFTFPEPIPLKYTLNKVMKGKVDRKFAFTVRIGGRRSGINNKFNWDSYRVDGEVRLITPEECLLLQGFPRRFKLLGNESERYFQVGNSVPVSIVHEIGKRLLELDVI
jgi:DNA (cytosine-5)-methyltransferase 1